LVLVAVAFHWEQHMDLVLVEVLQLARMRLLLHKCLRSLLVKLVVANYSL
jgi:hypothetical protein